MAFSVQGIDIAVETEDDSGTRATTKTSFDPAVAANQNYANLTAYATALGGAIDGVSDGQVNRYRINITSFDPVAAEDATFGSSNVERKAYFVFRSANNDRVQLLVPSPLAAEIDTADNLTVDDLVTPATAAEALAALIVNGDGTIRPCAPVSKALIAEVVKAYQYHTISQRQRRRRKG